MTPDNAAIRRFLSMRMAVVQVGMVGVGVLDFLVDMIVNVTS